MRASTDSIAHHVSRITSYVLRFTCYAFLLTLVFFCLHPSLSPVHADGPLGDVVWASRATLYTNSIAWGDYDGDGDLDLAVGNAGLYEDSDGINEVYRNDGGSFSLAWESIGNEKPTHSVAWGDYDGDGDLDLAVGNCNDVNQVFDNERGSFSLAWESTGDTLCTKSVAWGDWDGDGDLDLAVGNSNYEVNQVYENDGGTLKLDDGIGFGWESTSDARSTQSVAWGDWDGDGDLDLAVGNCCGGDTDNQVYENDGGDLTMAWEATGIARDTTSVAWGDWDGDGDLDLAVGNDDWDGTEVNQVYENDGGSLSLAWESTGDEKRTKSVAWGDYDGDGDLDLAVGNGGTWGAYEANQVYRNDGGSLSLAWESPGRAKDTSSVAWGDWDGDGDLDLAVGNRGYLEGDVTQIVENDGTQSLGLGWQEPPGDAAGTHSIAWGDWDGDGDLDLAVANPVWPAVYQNDGGKFSLAWEFTEGGFNDSRSVAWGDWDGDGDLDLAVGNAWGINRVFENNGGSLSLAWESTGDAKNTNSVAWGDWDGDGDLDLAVGNEPHVNQVYQNDGGSLSLAWESTGDEKSTRSVAWGDYDGDGDLDLAVGNGGEPGDEVNQVYRNDGGDLSLAWESTGDERTTYSVAWGDYDGDGDLDLAVGNCWWQVNQIYGNDGGDLSLAWESTGEMEYTYSVAWGDWDGDGDLDLAVGNGDDHGGGSVPNQVYRNDQGELTLAWEESSLDAQVTRDVAWGDMDGDGDLDLAVGDSGANRVYRNPHLGGARLANNPPTIRATGPYTASADFYASATVLQNPAISITYTLSDPEGDPAGRVAGSYSPDGGGRWLQAVATGDTITQNLALGAALAFDGQNDWVETTDFDIENDFTISFWTNPYTTTDGQAFIGKHTSVGDNLVAFVFYEDGYHVRIRGDSFTGGTKTTGWQHLAVVGEEHGITTTVTVYRNGEDLWQHDFSAVVGDVSGGKAWAIGQEWDVPSLQSDFFDGRIDEVRIWNVARTQMDIKADMYRGLVGDEPGLAAYWPFDEGSGVQVFDQSANGRNGSLGGGVAGQRPTWVGGPFATHVFHWDLLGSSFFGRSDNVVFHLKAYPQSAPEGASTPYHYLNSAPGPYQRPYASAQTFPFRVRGTQVRVYSETAAPGNEVAGALVYRLPADQPAGGFLIGNSTGVPFRTDHNGYLQGRGEIGLGDRLLAMLPITWTESYTLYYTSGAPTGKGLDTYTVTTPGVQTLVVSADHPLLLFNLDISLEWDAHNDAAFMEQLQYDLFRAAEYLYDFTDGQAGLGEVYVFHDAENWQAAHARVYASNRLRPNATLGGYVAGTVTDTLVPTITYESGQIRMPATWNRYGDPGGSVGEDWPRTLAHEFGHYYLFLDDHYLGLDEDGQVISIYTCTHTAMTDPYRYSEYRDQGDWLPACADTMANHLTGRSDWATIETFYPELSGPDTRGTNDGPTLSPFDFTEITVFDPLMPTETIPDPTFYFLTEGGQRYQPGEGTRGYLLKDETWLVDVGEPVIDHILARGAKAGDRLCVFDTANSRLGCETVERGDDQMVLYGFPEWHPEIVVTPVATDAIGVSVYAADLLSLQGRIFSTDGPATEIFDFTETGSGTYETTMTSTNVLLLQGFVQIWVNETPHRREMITDYAIGASPGFTRGHGGFTRGHGGFTRGHGGFTRGHGGFTRGHGVPILSGDGQVTIYTPDPEIPDGEFLTIQAATGVPELPPGRVQIGQAYRIAATEGITNLDESSISFQYLGDAVPAGMEEDITIYTWDGASWHILPTTLNPVDNFASARVEGSGLYALLTAFRIPLYAPGWNLFSYPMRASQPVSAALVSIEGEYGIVYGYDATQSAWEAWDVYGVGVPGYVNDLEELVFGRGYWISVTRAITMYIGGTGGQSEMSAASLPPQVPATYYGRVLGGIGPGETVRAWVDGNLCGQGQTMQAGGGVAYAINVLPEEGGLPGCGAAGREITFQVGSVMMHQTVTWDANRLWEVWLSEMLMPFDLYLPSVLRGD